MNLNDDAGEDNTFDDLFNSDNSSLNPNQPVTDLKVIIADGEDRVDVTKEQLFGQNLVENELPNLNAVFITDIRSAGSVAAELIDIREDLKKSNGVSREDAELIDSLTAGFINPKKPIGFFTEDKSKTQYQQTFQCLDKEIDARLLLINEGIGKFTDKVAELTLPTIKELDQEVQDKISVLQMEIQKLLVTVSYPSNQTRLPEDVSVNTFLETNCKVRNYDEDYSNKDIKDYPNDLKLAITELRKLGNRPSTFIDKLEHIFISELKGYKETFFSFGEVSNSIILSSTLPCIYDIPKNHSFNQDNLDINKRSIYLTSTLITSYFTSIRLKELIACSVNLTTAIIQQKTIAQAVMSKTDSTLSDKLNELKLISHDLTRWSLLVTNIITFFKELHTYLYRLKVVFEKVALA